MNQKMIKILGGIIAGFVLFIIILFLISSCSKSSYTYEKLEAKMLNVAKNYYENNSEELPREDTDTKSYTLKKMIENGYIDELTELFDDESIKCDGNVTVQNNNGHYLYTPYLKCGKDYSTKYLKDVIIENSLVDNGSFGLYEQNDEYIFRGEIDNNYISYNDTLYRILRINSDGSIRVMDLSNELYTVYWDNRYNTEKRDNSGYNDYVVNGTINSRIKDTLDNYYNNDKYFDDTFRTYVSTQNLCVGKRSLADTTIDGKTECINTIPTQFGTFAVYEYAQASLDNTCQSAWDKTCTNYNWLKKLTLNTWTITAVADSNNEAYSFLRPLQVSECGEINDLRVTFNFANRLVYESGTGTETDPYKFVIDQE